MSKSRCEVYLSKYDKQCFTATVPTLPVIEGIDPVASPVSGGPMAVTSADDCDDGCSTVVCVVLILLVCWPWQMTLVQCWRLYDHERFQTPLIGPDPGSLRTASTKHLCVLELCRTSRMETDKRVNGQKKKKTVIIPIKKRDRNIIFYFDNKKTTKKYYFLPGILKWMWYTHCVMWCSKCMNLIIFFSKASVIL